MNVHALENVLTPGLAARLSTEVRSIISPVSRTVFLSQYFLAHGTLEEVGAPAFEKFLLPDLVKLDSLYKIVGALSGPSIIKLASPKVKEYILANGEIGELEKMEEMERIREANENVPPYAYAVFVFPAIESILGLFCTPIPESEFVAALRQQGIDTATGEGAVAGQTSPPTL